MYYPIMMAVNNAADDDMPLLATRMEKKRQEDKKEEEEQQQQQHYLTWTTITKDPVYSEWMETLKPSTALGYRSGILAMCRFYKVKPSDMRAWDSQTANDKLKQFVLYLKRNAKPYGGKRRSSGEFSVNSIPTYFYAIINFFEHFDIEVKTKKLAKMMPEQVESDLRPYKREEISKLLSLAKPKERVIILTPEACGAREGGLDMLKSCSQRRL
jgi:hypothetical protein